MKTRDIKGMLSSLGIRIIHLIDRCIFQRSRAEELLQLRLRLVQQPPRSQLSEEERDLADQLRLQRIALSTALGSVNTCCSCARGQPLPHGRWEGGFCCGGNTEDLFSDYELAALRATGTTPLDLRAPHSDHAGCVLRGPHGCSLSPIHRPTICLGHTCCDLAHELALRGDYEHIDLLSRRLKETFERFAALQHKRAEDKLVALWEAELKDLL